MTISYAALSLGKSSQSLGVNMDAGASNNYEGSDLEALSTLGRYQNWIIQNFRPYLRGRAVEFGAGLGNISALLKPHVSKLDLVEPSVNLAARLETRFVGDDSIQVFAEPLEKRIPDTGDEAYDSVVLVNVLEHIKDDAAALSGLMRILRPGCHLLLFVPALKFLYSDLDALHGHYRRYELGELNAHTEAAGFEIIQSRYFDAVGVLPWYLLNTLLGATAFNPFMVRIYDAVLAPLSRGIDRMITPPFGKNILLVAKRPDVPSS
ncbi:MAG: class I SAM-dependent methyltransferase [Rhodospirillales bacterium]